jgi:glycosyltransferase involved in cell wall biosynthesis
LARDDRIFLVSDQSPYSGIGAYTAGLYQMLRPLFPGLRWLDMGYRADTGPGPPGAERLAGLERTARLLDVPGVRRRNRERLARGGVLSGAFLHDCGTDYSIGEGATRRIATVHDYYFRSLNGRSLAHPIDLLRDMYQNRLNLRLARELAAFDAVVVPSEHVRKVLRRRLGVEAVTIPIPIDRTRFRPRPREEVRARLGLPAGRRILLNVGAATWNKNLGTLERVARRLPPDVLVVKVGAPLSGPPDRVLNRSHVPADLYPLYFNASDGYVHTSREEGFGIPLLEALASGIPVVAPPSSGAPEILGDLGHYTSSPFDVPGYIARVAELAKDGDPRRAEAASVRRSERFSPEAVAPAYANVYERAFRGSA